MALNKRVSEKGVGNLFSVCVGACGESDDKLSTETVPGTFPELTLLLLPGGI